MTSPRSSAASSSITALAGRQVLTASGNPATVSLLIANLLMTNRQAGMFLSIVEGADPDLLLTLENDNRWDRELGVLHSEYPYRVLHPQKNTYGMGLYSLLPLSNSEVRFLVDHEIPSIRTDVQLKDGSRLV